MLRYTFKNIENAYKEKIANQEGSIFKYLSAIYGAYDSFVLDNFADNHFGGMVLASALWRIREKIGQETTDLLVAQTIVNLNEYQNMREDYYIGDKSDLYSGIDWSDVLFGMINKDKEYFDGKNIPIIIDEFSKTGYPVQSVKY